VVKKPSACEPQAEGPIYHHEMEVRETVDSESLDDSREKAEGSLAECSNAVRGLFKLTNLFIYFILVFSQVSGLIKNIANNSRILLLVQDICIQNCNIALGWNANLI
jgi:hypothetical protein